MRADHRRAATAAVQPPPVVLGRAALLVTQRLGVYWMQIDEVPPG